MSLFVAQVFVLKSSSKTTHTVGTNNKYTLLLSSTNTIMYIISSTHSTFESKASKKAVTVAKAMMEEEAFE